MYIYGVQAQRARERGVDPPRTKEPTFTAAEEDYIWGTLEMHIDGVREVRRHGDRNGDDEEEREHTPDWSVQDIYHGLTPKSIAQSWKVGFKTTTRIATYMAGRFVKAIEEFGRTEIWNKRCKVTVEWEKARGITAMSKRARGRNCVGEHRRSSNDFLVPSLRQRQKLNVRETYKILDDRVRDSYVGKTKLDVMERLGGMKFLMTMDSG
ncbi:hypothetical protein BX616_006877 [Lobosporangium transversale]|nr:hypothetical protein BX616_006877 [Lobosporangium transversale]